jgi:hypothetical protein
MSSFIVAVSDHFPVSFSTPKQNQHTSKQSKCTQTYDPIQVFVLLLPIALGALMHYTGVASSGSILASPAFRCKLFCLFV